MHIHTLENWQHEHDFAVIHEKGERRTFQVLLLTVITMAAEIIAGQIYGSMALLADGWHMGTHAAAFSITIFAYHYTKRHATNPKFSFGTGKVSVLGGFASAVALAVVALLMIAESVHRLYNPQQIKFNEAIAIAALGLVINLICAVLLHDHHGHDHDDERDHHLHHDHNLKAAYIHVLADALTSLLAIIALFAGKYLGWNWMDPIMGIVGAMVITRWSYGLIRETSAILLDQSITDERKVTIQEAIEAVSDIKVADMHIWKVGSAHYAAIISIVSHYEQSPVHLKNMLSGFKELSHVTVEVNQCHGKSCVVDNGHQA